MGRNRSFLKVRIGTNNVQDVNGALLEVAQIRIHPKFNPITRLNDISTLQTVQIIIFNQYIRPIALTSLYYRVRGAIVSGWGQVLVSYTAT